MPPGASPSLEPTTPATDVAKHGQGRVCPPPLRKRMSAIQLEVWYRLNNPAFGAREKKEAKPRREKVKPVPVLELKSIPEPPKVEVERFVWDRSKTLPLAAAHCTYCMGLGLMGSWRSGETRPCGCVLRRVFNSVLGKYRYIQAHQDRVSSSVTTVMKHGRENKRVWSRKNEEFCADFYLVSKRMLDEKDWKLFELHMLCGYNWRYCTRILGMDRGRFFHAVYRIQERLGRVFVELRPYALFPIDEYFGGVRSDKKPVCDRHQVSHGLRATIRRAVGAVV
jgi:hypothetical protein